MNSRSLLLGAEIDVHPSKRNAVGSAVHIKKRGRLGFGGCQGNRQKKANETNLKGRVDFLLAQKTRTFRSHSCFKYPHLGRI